MFISFTSLPVSFFSTVSASIFEESSTECTSSDFSAVSAWSSECNSMFDASYLKDEFAHSKLSSSSKRAFEVDKLGVSFVEILWVFDVFDKSFFGVEVIGLISKPEISLGNAGQCLSLFKCDNVSAMGVIFFGISIFGSEKLILVTFQASVRESLFFLCVFSKEDEADGGVLLFFLHLLSPE